jgi:hypothetical protein
MRSRYVPVVGMIHSGYTGMWIPVALLSAVPNAGKIVLGIKIYNKAPAKCQGPISDKFL